MSEVSDRYGRVASGFTARLEGVAPERWSAASPCAEWTARDVAAHVVNVHHRVMATLDGGEAAVVDAADDDLDRRWSAVSAAVSAALADGDRASTTVSGIFGEQPFESLVGRLLCADTLIHTWDLARATGQDEALDADAVAKAMEFLTPIAEAIRRPGGFAPAIESPEGADPQTRLINFAGREA